MRHTCTIEFALLFSLFEVIKSKISLQATMNLQLLLYAVSLGLSDLVNARPKEPAQTEKQCIISEAVCLLHTLFVFTFLITNSK